MELPVQNLIHLYILFPYILNVAPTMMVGNFSDRLFYSTNEGTCRNYSGDLFHHTSSSFSSVFQMFPEFNNDLQ